MVKFSCKGKKDNCGPGDEKAHIAGKSQGSHKVENKTLFNVRIYTDISEWVTGCSLGTRLVSQIFVPRPQSAWYSVLFFFVFAHEVFGWSVSCSWHNNLSNNRLTVPCCFHGCWQVVPCCFHAIFASGFSVRHRFCLARICSPFSA